MTQKKFFIKTFGCQQNEADSERIGSLLKARGMQPVKTLSAANHIVINTCMVRESAENRVYGLVNNLRKRKDRGEKLKVVLTGCMVGMAARDPSGKMLALLKKRLPGADEFLPIEEVGFDHAPLRTDKNHAWVPISNGCNNFCTFCVVPYTRGREISRPYQDILHEVTNLAQLGYEKITLLGMNVNSYGADLVLGQNNIQVLRDINKNYFTADIKPAKTKETFYKLPSGKSVKPVLVKHLGRLRIPTLFPYLLEDVCKITGIKEVDFISSNPWDFSDRLIETIAKNPKITRSLHLAVQSGSDRILKKMNRWYTKAAFLHLLEKMRRQIPGVRFSTDIIVGFCDETEADFHETVDLVKKANFYKAYISVYSKRPMTAATQSFEDNVPHKEKRRRWRELDKLIYKKSS